MSKILISELPERGLVRLAGPDAAPFLQNLISNDVAKATAGEAIYASLLTPQGKFLHDFFLWSEAGDLVVDCEGPRRADLIRRLTFYRLRAKVEITDLTAERRVFAVWGPNALGALGLPERPGARAGDAFVDPRLTALGARLVVDTDAPPPALGAEPADYDSHRLGLGVPDGSRDLAVERSLLLEGRIDDLNGVDFNKGCYVGQELTARTKYRGTVKRRLFRVAAEGPPPAPETPVLLGAKQAGHITSMAAGAGLAMLRIADVEQALTAGPKLTAAGTALTPSAPAWAKA